MEGEVLVDLNFADIEVGHELPPIKKPAFTRTTLALFAGASNDHNPIHIDTDFAQASGMGDVIAHGMLGMAYMAHLLTGWVDQRSIRSYGVRFRRVMAIGDAITCVGEVESKSVEQGEERLILKLTAKNQDDEIKLEGYATVAMPKK